MKDEIKTEGGTLVALTFCLYFILHPYFVPMAHR